MVAYSLALWEKSWPNESMIRPDLNNKMLG